MITKGSDHFRAVKDKIINVNLQDTVLSPKDGIAMEVLGGVKPQAESLFSIAHTINVDIGLEQIRFTGCVTQELEIKFMMFWTIRRHLQKYKKTVIKKMCLKLTCKAI